MLRCCDDFSQLRFSVGFLIWVAWYVRGNIEAFAPILDVTWLDGLNLTLAFLAIMVGNGLFISIVSSALGIRLTCREYTSLSFASSFANFFLPFRGGAGIRALYMSRMHSFPVAEFLSTLSIMYLMHSVINGLLALTGMGLIAAKGGPVDLTLTRFLWVYRRRRIGRNVNRFRFREREQAFPTCATCPVYAGIAHTAG